ncbi:MAG TPA: TetR/AcrR family transcriptional regulator [Jiangellaceae bacterium]|nr:TetR/AcrR family transcriptional regulator [Jiangellaceae bacterium]
MAGRKDEAPDPARSLGLLWGVRGKPGRSGLTVDAIIATAIDIADVDGIDAVSMRRIAERLDVGTMSLYTHVPGKTDLTNLMIDTVLARIYDDVDAPVRAPGGWRGSLTFIAERNWDLYLRHPWLLEVVGPRPVLGPNTTLKYEAELRPLDGLGLSDVEMDSVLTLVLTHVAGTARAQVSVAHTTQESGLTDLEWWSITGPILERLIDARTFPVAVRVGESSATQYAAAADPVHALRFGLECILDGVEVLIERRGQP